MAVGDRGAVVTREGDKWREAPSPTQTDIFDIHGYDWQNIWAICAEGVLFFDGSGWELQRPGRHYRVDRIFCRGPDDIMVVTGEHLSLHFDGLSWTAQTLEISPVSRESDWLVGWFGGFTAVGHDGQVVTWQNGQWGPVEVVSEQVALTHVMVRSDQWTPPEETALVAFGTLTSNPDYIGIYDRYPSDNWYSWDSIADAGNVLDIAPGGPEGGYYVVTRTANQDTVQVSYLNYQGNALTFPGLDDAVFRVFRNTLDHSTRRTHFVMTGPFGTFYTGNNDVGVESSLGGVPFEATTIHVWPNGDFTGMDWQKNLIHGRGNQVTLQKNIFPETVSSIWGPSPDLIYAVGYDGLILRLSGTSPPVEMVSPVSSFLTTIWGTGPDNIWAGGSDAFLHFDGSVWTSLAVPANFLGEKLTGTASGDVYAVSHYEIQKWDGATWTNMMPPEAGIAPLIAAAPAGQNLFAVVRESVNGDRVWTLRRLRDDTWETLTEVPEDTHSLVALTDDSVMVAAREGCFIWQNDSWKPVSHPSNSRYFGNIREIFGGPDGGVYSINGERSIHYLDLGGTALWH